MDNIVKMMVCAVVDVPDKVRIDEVNDEDTITYRVFVAAEDVGKVLGKQGRVANAIRTITKSNARRDGKKVYLDVVAEGL